MARYYSGNNQPLTHWNNLPIYLATILTGAFVAGYAATAILRAVYSPAIGWLDFSMPLMPTWSLWRLVTYVFTDRVSFFTPFALFFFYWMSVGVETHLGRAVLTKLLLIITLIAPAVAALWWTVNVPSNLDAQYAFMGGLLVAFATLYPNTEAWGWIPFKWVAFACIVCGSLMLLAEHNWPGLSVLWASCAAGFAYTRHAKELDYDDYESPLARFGKLFQRKPKFRVLPTPTSRRRDLVESDELESVDPLLDKIARTGMASLTAKERARLEKAREALIKKDRE